VDGVHDRATGKALEGADRQTNRPSVHYSKILQHHTLSVYKNTNYPHFETCHVMFQYCLVKCIIPICIFTATTTDESSTIFPPLIQTLII